MDCFCLVWILSLTTLEIPHQIHVHWRYHQRWNSEDHSTTAPIIADPIEIYDAGCEERGKYCIGIPRWAVVTRRDGLKTASGSYLIPEVDYFLLLDKFDEIELY